MVPACVLHHVHVDPADPFGLAALQRRRFGQRLHRAAADLLTTLEGRHGALMFHQSGGCCDGSSPMCFPDGDFITSEADILLGKLVTTQFAFADPSRTRNPWNDERTPGGSSSGSAAGVAARLISVAFGSQTAGSVLRPAAYNGVVGFKPTYGRISKRGVLPLAWSLDHVGVLSRSVADIGLVRVTHKSVTLVQPRGTIVLKTTVAEPPRTPLAPIVVDEITVIGSRCGPFPRAPAGFARLEAVGVRLSALLQMTFALREGVAAYEHAGTRGMLKILLTP